MNKVRKFAVFILLAMIISFANVSPASAAAVTLQQGTATWSQEDWCCGLNVDEAVDGVISGTNGPLDPYNGWAIYSDIGSNAQTAVWETSSDINASKLDFNLYHTWAGDSSLGRFRLSYTTDDRSMFADGLTQAEM